MGATQTTSNHLKRYRIPSLMKSVNNHVRPKHPEGFRTTMGSITFGASVPKHYLETISSSSVSTVNNSAETSPYSLTTVNSQTSSLPYLSDFDYQKLSTLTGLSETKINDLHREFLLLSCDGKLTYEKYKEMFKAVPIQQKSEEIEKLARETFRLFDKDGNNYLDFAEFIAAYITMEKNEALLSDQTQLNQTLTIPQTHSTKQNKAIYYTPRKPMVNATPITSHRSLQLPNNYVAYRPQSSEQYVYVSSPYTFR